MSLRKYSSFLVCALLIATCAWAQRPGAAPAFQGRSFRGQPLRFQAQGQSFRPQDNFALFPFRQRRVFFSPFFLPLSPYWWPGTFPAYSRFGYYGNGLSPFGPYGGYPGYYGRPDDGETGAYNPSTGEKPSAAPPPAQAPEPPNANDAKGETLPPRDALLTLDGQELSSSPDGGNLVIGSGHHTLRLSSRAPK